MFFAIFFILEIDNNKAQLHTFSTVSKLSNPEVAQVSQYPPLRTGSQRGLRASRWDPRMEARMTHMYTGR